MQIKLSFEKPLQLIHPVTPEQRNTSVTHQCFQIWKGFDKCQTELAQQVSCGGEKSVQPPEEGMEYLRGEIIYLLNSNIYFILFRCLAVKKGVEGCQRCFRKVCW